MAWRYLETEYLATRKRSRITDDILAGVSAHGVAHPSAVPEHWRAFFNALQPSLMSSRPRSIIRKARNFSFRQRQIILEVALVDYILAKNQNGLAVSSRAVLAQKGFLFDLLMVESHKRWAKLTRKGIKWVAHWQKRHGLTRGRFRQGCGLTPEQQRAKVRRVKINFLSCGFFFSGSGFCFWVEKIAGARFVF